MCEKKKTKESSETRKWERIFVPRMNLLTSDINRHILIYIRQFPVTPSTCTYIFLYCFNLTMIQILMNVEIVVKITVLMSSKEYKTWSLYTSRKKIQLKSNLLNNNYPQNILSTLIGRGVMWKLINWPLFIYPMGKTSLKKYQIYVVHLISEGYWWAIQNFVDIFE